GVVKPTGKSPTLSGQSVQVARSRPSLSVLIVCGLHPAARVENDLLADGAHTLCGGTAVMAQGADGGTGPDSS
ncbi:hypothetical protein ABG768_027933, partial [Culter alburnus]